MTCILPWFIRILSGAPHGRKTDQLLSHLLSFCAWQCNSLRITCGIITGCQNELASSLNTGKWFNDIRSYLLEGLINHRHGDHLGPNKIFTVTLLTYLAPMVVISFISKNLWPVVPLEEMVLCLGDSTAIRMFGHRYVMDKP